MPTVVCSWSGCSFKDVEYPASYLVMADVELFSTPSAPQPSGAAASNVSATAGTTGPSTSLPPHRRLASSPPSQPQVALSKALSGAHVASALRRALGEEPTDKLDVQQQVRETHTSEQRSQGIPTDFDSILAFGLCAAVNSGQGLPVSIVCKAAAPWVALSTSCFYRSCGGITRESDI